MKLKTSVFLSLLAASTVSAAAIKDERFHKRDVDYVTLVTTVDLALSDYIQATAAATTSTAAAVATTAAATSTRSSGGLFGSLLSGLRGWLSGDDDSTTTAAATTTSLATPATTSLAAAATTTAAASSSDDNDNGIFDLFDTLFGRTSRKTTQVSATTAATASTSVSVVASATTSTDSDSSSTSTSSPETPSDYNQVETYAALGAGIAYSPYTKSGSCKSQSQVQHDMDVLSAFGIIRLYGVDCSGVDNVLATISSSQKVFVGIYNIDDSSINTDLSTLKTAVEGSTRGWDAIHTVSIGNELVNAGTATASQIVSAMQTARAWFKSNASDYTGSLVSVDTLVAVKGNPSLCDASDYLAVNCHPFWDGGVDPSNSGPWLQEQIAALKSVCGSSKKVFITESGWPTQGDTYGSCVPSVANQLAAVKSIGQTLGDDVLMFTTYTDYWKDPGAYNVEQHWGIFGDPAA